MNDRITECFDRSIIFAGEFEPVCPRTEARIQNKGARQINHMGHPHQIGQQTDQYQQNGIAKH